MITNKEEINIDILLKMQSDLLEKIEYPDLREKIIILSNFAYELGKKEKFNQ